MCELDLRPPESHALPTPRFQLPGARAGEHFARQRVMQTLGVEIARLEPGEIELAMPYDLAYTQQHGFMHAGIITTALDTACGYAAFRSCPRTLRS